jgi:zinc finger CCHC domain-containing protein 8
MTLFHRLRETVMKILWVKKFHDPVFSDSLREALGLKPDQLPTYIYRMRLFGYPPGWLAEASKKSNNLAMYDKDGRGE